MYIGMVVFVCANEEIGGNKFMKMSELENGKNRLKYISLYNKFNSAHKSMFGQEKHVGLPKNFSEPLVKEMLSLEDAETSDFDGKKDGKNYEIKSTSKNGKTTFSKKEPDTVAWLLVLPEKLEVYQIDFSIVKNFLRNPGNRDRSSANFNCFRSKATLEKTITYE